jgi:hypothetical protein
MRLFHRHEWKEQERMIAGPRTFKASTALVSEYCLERLCFGVTTILFRCDCGAVKTVEMLGAKK